MTFICSSVNSLRFPMNLICLSMNGTTLCDTGAKELCKLLLTSFSSTLRELMLRENQCTKRTAVSIAAYLRVDTCNLICLDLSWNNIRTEGGIEVSFTKISFSDTDNIEMTVKNFKITILQILKAIWSASSHLQRLKLDWNGLNDEFLPCLEMFITSSPNRSLKHLSMCNNLLSLRRLKGMENKRPQLEICYSEIQFTSRFG